MRLLSLLMSSLLGTPLPSPSTTPINFYDSDRSGSSTPVARSPFSLHSPRFRNDRIRADSNGTKFPSMRGRLPGGSGTYPPGASPEALSSPSSYQDYPDDTSDLEDEQGMLQYDPLSPSFDRAQHGFHLDRTRDLLRVPLDLESLSLPPAGKQPQRLREPQRVGSNGGESILSMVGPNGKGELVTPHAVKPGDHLSKLIVAANGESTTPSASTPIGSDDSAFAHPSASPIGEDDTNTPNDGSSHHQTSVRKKSFAATHGQQAHKKRTKSKAAPEETAVVRRTKPKSVRTYITYAVVAALAAILIYCLFFTTLAPELEPYQPKPITEKGAKVKIPKVQTK